MAKTNAKTKSSKEPPAPGFETEFKMVPVSLILSDNANPRKTAGLFAGQMTDLQDSIRANGILQPLLVRPNGDKFTIVCGQRRLLAARNIGLDAVPCTVRIMSDEESLSAQIVENLQREAISLLEESDAYRSLLIVRNIDAEEVAKLVGRSVAYVTTRLNLENLISEWRLVLSMNKMRLKTALTMAKVPKAVQLDAYQDATSSYYNRDGQWKDRSDDLIDFKDAENVLERELIDLKKAPFDITSETLHKDAGACTTCQHNTANMRSLFPEHQDETFCKNKSCFNIKERLSYELTLAEVAAVPDSVGVVTNYNQSTENKACIEAAKAHNIPVLNRQDFDIIEEPEHPGTLEDWLKENIMYDKDENPEDYAEEVEEETENYTRAIRDYNQELAEFNLKLPESKKAFVVAGHMKGQWINIVASTEKAQSILAVGDTTTGGEIDNNAALYAEEVSKLNTREARAKELDREKIYARVHPEILKDYVNDGFLGADETIAAVMALCALEYKVRESICKELVGDSDYRLHDTFEKLRNLDAPTLNGMLNRALRICILEMINANELDYGKNGKPAAIMHVAKFLNDPRVNEIVMDQVAIAEKRERNIGHKIADLKKQYNIEE